MLAVWLKWYKLTGKNWCETKIVSYEWGEYLKRAKSGEHQAVMMGWTGDNGDPDNFLPHCLVALRKSKALTTRNGVISRLKI